MADRIAIIAPMSTVTTTGIASDVIALPVNSVRGGWSIQNISTNALFVRLGLDASDTNFNYVLKAGTGTKDGTGGVISQEDGVIYTGIITIAGTSPSYVASEFTQ